MFHLDNGTVQRTVTRMTTSRTAQELSQARAALARARKRGDARQIAHLQGIVGNLTLLARTNR